jgi:S-adenosyl-L-methionine hydrolase (adenosine-forming)
LERVPAITLTTDFGTSDGYAAALKGVLTRLAPGVPLIDIAHDIAPFDKVGALLALRNALKSFPSGCVHLVVVDPGVGSARNGLIVVVAGHTLVGPDNGIVTGVFPLAGMQTYIIEEAGFADASPTFQGRDIFAPIVAKLAAGATPESLGSLLEEPQRLRLPLASRTGNLIKGEIIHVDRFGNLVSNIPRNIVADAARIAVSVNFAPVRSGRTFSDVAPGESVAYWGSAGLLEIGVREGNAGKKLGGRGMPVEVVPFFS